MEIIVYAKKNCGICEGLKDKLRKNLKVAFTECDLDLALQASDTWRDDGSVELSAQHAAINAQIPMILIDGQVYHYAAALKEIKRRLTEGEKATVPVTVPGSGKDPLNRIDPISEAAFLPLLQIACEGMVDQVSIESPLVRHYDQDGRIKEDWKPPISVQVTLRRCGPPVLTAAIHVRADTFNALILKVRTRYEKFREQGGV